MKRVLPLRSNKTIAEGYYLVRLHYANRDMLLSRIAETLHSRIMIANESHLDPEITVASVKPVATSKAKSLTSYGKIRRQ